MPTERKFRVLFTFFCYGGNGGIASTNPELLRWWGQQTVKLHNHPQIGDGNYGMTIISDTPITMTRNRAVLEARKWKADFLVMLDSDNIPDLTLASNPEAKPFLDSSFEFLVANYDKGPHVVCAPYCGPPLHPVHGGEENVYVFQWVNFESDEKEPMFAIKGYKREHAAIMRGIQSCAAGATGVIMYDLRAFDLLTPPYFDYEWNADHSDKASTEDVFNTRNIALHGLEELGYNPLHCNWDAWAGHAKTKIVGPPSLLYTDDVHKYYQEAVRRNLNRNERIIDFEAKPLPKKNGRVPNPKFLLQLPGGGVDLTGYQWDDLRDQVERDPWKGVHVCDDDRAEIKRLVEAAAKRVKLRGGILRIVEVGTWIGSTAKFMAEVLNSLDVGYRIDTVDTFAGSGSDATGAIATLYGGSMLRKYQENLGELYRTKIFEHVGKSQEIAQQWTDKADLIFLDADHGYEAVLADILAWTPHLRSGGTLCGHDYTSEFEGVKRAVCEVFKRHRVCSAVWSVEIKEQPTISNGLSCGAIDVRTADNDLEEFVPTGV